MKLANMPGANRDCALFAFAPLAIAIVLCFFTGACSTPEPRIITQEVKVAVPVPCPVTLPPRPALMTKEQVGAAMEGAANLDDRLKILVSQTLLYIGWVPVLEAGLAGCSGVKAEPTSNAGS